MNRDEAIALLQRGPDGVREWNQWREKGEELPVLIRVNLSGADLCGADLCHANLSDAKLCGADLTDAKLVVARLRHADLASASLRHARLSYAELNDANLSNARLSHADLSYADLRHTNLSHADLTGVDLTDTVLMEAQLSGADLQRATTLMTTFAGVNLSDVVGLKEVNHLGPSRIDIETLYVSRGKIPAVFLRGCGVPDELIAYLPSLLGARQAIEFYSCFISYSHRDEEFTKRLHSRMRDEHLRVWYAPEDMQGGKKIHEQIDHAIRVNDKLLLVLSKNSMGSEWVKTEIRKARKREEREGKRVLFPIRLVPFDMIRDWEAFDADTGKDMGVEVREYFIPDFSNWKDHDAFETAFKRLLDDLKKAAE